MSQWHENSGSLTWDGIAVDVLGESCGVDKMTETLGEAAEALRTLQFHSLLARATCPARN